MLFDNYCIFGSYCLEIEIFDVVFVMASVQYVNCNVKNFYTKMIQKFRYQVVLKYFNAEFDKSLVPCTNDIKVSVILLILLVSHLVIYFLEQVSECP